MPYILYSCEKLSAENPFNLSSKVEWKIPVSQLQEAGRSNYRDFLMEKVSQAESQKVKEISQVLKVIDQFGPINTKIIRKRSKLSWDSVNRTLDLFRRKKIVKVVQPRTKKNNEKIYSLVKNRAIMYYSHLLMWKNRKPFLRQLAQWRKSENTWRKIEKRLPRGWRDWEINLPSKSVKHFNKNKLSIIHFFEWKKLMINYYAGIYCRDCFGNGVIIQLKNLPDGISFCANCKRESYYEDEFPITKGRKKGRMRFPVDKDIDSILRK